MNNKTPNVTTTNTPKKNDNPPIIINMTTLGPGIDKKGGKN